MTPLAALRHPGQGHDPGILCCSAHCSQGKNEMQIHGAALSGFLLPGQISSQAVVPRPCPQTGRSPHVPKDRDVPLGSAVWYRQKQRHHNQDRTLITGAGEVCTAALISCVPQINEVLWHRVVLCVPWKHRVGLSRAWSSLPMHAGCNCSSAQGQAAGSCAAGCVCSCVLCREVPASLGVVVLSCGVRQQKIY